MKNSFNGILNSFSQCLAFVGMRFLKQVFGLKQHRATPRTVPVWLLQRWVKYTSIRFIHHNSHVILICARWFHLHRFYCCYGRQPYRLILQLADLCYNCREWILTIIVFGRPASSKKSSYSFWFLGTYWNYNKFTSHQFQVKLLSVKKIAGN